VHAVTCLSFYSFVVKILRQNTKKPLSLPIACRDKSYKNSCGTTLR